MFRYSVPIDGEPHTIELTNCPTETAVVAAAGGVVEFWAENFDREPVFKRTYQVFGTGHPLPPDANHVGTCPRTPEGLVWHLFELARLRVGRPVER